MSTDAPTRPRLARPRVASEWLSTRDRAGWPAPPSGEERPVVLVPGFLAADSSLTRMGAWLTLGGWSVHRSGLSGNADCMEPTVRALRSRLEVLAARHGRGVTLVGHSRGGAVSRALTVLHPGLVEQLVTLGSPLTDPLALQRRTWASVGAVSLLGTVGVPRMFSLRCLRGDCCKRTRAALTAPFPADVPFTSIYSPSDEVVRPDACLDPAADAVAVDCSHIGMGHDRRVWDVLARTLSPAVVGR